MSHWEYFFQHNFHQETKILDILFSMGVCSSGMSLLNKNGPGLEEEKDVENTSLQIFEYKPQLVVIRKNKLLCFYTTD